MVVTRAPLHEQIMEVLRKEVRTEYVPGDRLPPEPELADRFGVSIVTLREAVLRLCQEGLLERRQGSGTYVLELATRSVVMLVREAIYRQRGSFFFLRLAEVLQQRLRDLDVSVRMIPRQSDDGPGEDPLTEELESGVIDAVVAVSLQLSKTWRTFLQERGIPLVSCGYGEGFAVNYEHRRLVRRATRWLIENGCERLALMYWGAENEGDTEFFVDPFRGELQAHDLPYNPDWVFGSVNPTQPGNDWDHFEGAWGETAEAPDGLLVTDDCLFREAASAILCLGATVPDDLLVVTHATRGADIVYPFPVTRFISDPELEAEKTVGMVKRLLNGKTVEQPHVDLEFDMEEAGSKRSITP